MHRKSKPPLPSQLSTALLRIRSLLVKTDGKISFVAIPWILGIIVLIGLVGNSGQAVVEKQITQDTVDAAASAAALWQARGLNSITTANHLMGEFTALVVIHEALGGPELEKGEELQTDENDKVQDELKELKPDAPHIGPPLFFFATFGEFRKYDKAVVDNIVDQIVDTKMISGATIYDARMTLKSCTVLLLRIKKTANEVAKAGAILSQIPIFAPIGKALEALAFGVHVTATAELVIVGKEWLVINVHELGAIASSPAKKMIRSAIIPALSKYEDLIAGKFEISPVNSSILRTTENLRSQNTLDELLIFPNPNIGASGERLRLPVSSEPFESGGDTSKPESQWSGKDPLLGAMSPILALQEGIPDLLGRATKLLDFVEALADLVPGLEAPNTSLPASSPLNITLFHDKNWPENPSFTDSLPEFDWQKERITQFNRSTYTYVDAFRRPVRGGWMEPEPWSPTGIPTSLAAQYFTHWTNRYSVTESNRLRESGAHMYVLDDMTAEQKGNEPWTTDDRRAEVLFSVMAMGRIQRRSPTLFPSLFKDANTFDTVAVAQALVYNANGRQLVGDNLHQPNTGWDTLNWEPRVAAPEWSDHAPGRTDGKFIFEILTGVSPVQTRSSRVKLNWQAKLIPITEQRLEDALKATMSGGMKQPLSTLQKHFPLVTH